MNSYVLLALAALSMSVQLVKSSGPSEAVEGGCGSGEISITVPEDAGSCRTECAVRGYGFVNGPFSTLDNHGVKCCCKSDLSLTSQFAVSENEPFLVEGNCRDDQAKISIPRGDKTSCHQHCKNVGYKNGYGPYGNPMDTAAKCCCNYELAHFEDPE